MKLSRQLFISWARYACLATSFLAAVTTNAVTIPNAPLSVQTSAKPMIMLAMGKDHRMFYEAYNDASDIDGDGTLDIRFKPSIIYLGLFDSAVCYTHNEANDGTGLFTPSSVAVGALKTCSSQWSGNWLNYITTTRIDALRVVLYGGTREVDTTSSTILRRAYIPQDAHTWAKEYTSIAVDGYSIKDYTPLDLPANSKRHFFGSLTPNVNTDCATLNNCSESKHPWLSVVTDSPKRVWEWASTERPVLADGTHGGSRKNRTVRVAVCTGIAKTGCKEYPNGQFKPTGLLHDFGEDEASLFGLMSGTYDQNFSGGRLRKVMSSFKNEVDQDTGQFTAAATLVQTIDKLRIRDFNNGRTDGIYRGGFNNVNRVADQGERPDWGNPMGEILYEAERYLSNKGAPTSIFATSSTFDDQVGLPKPNWDKPYSASTAATATADNTFESNSTAKAPWCSRANILAISDTNVSYDSDDLPGVSSDFGAGIATDLSGASILNGSTATTLNVGAIAESITNDETDIKGLKFIGQSGSVIDSAPTAKTVTSLAKIRGLAPEEATKRGSYYAASVANYAKVNDLQTSRKGKQTIDSFFVALASPLPRIEAKLPNGKVITLVPFAKSISGGSISNVKGDFQPTNQIVDFYVESIANSGAGDIDAAVNGGRYQAKFRINFEDVEQGADHDMDAIVEYTVKANANNTLEVKLTPIYQAGGIQHRMGYIISGSTNDGIHLVVQDEADTKSYFLNVPPGQNPGYCDTTGTPPNACKRLPYLGAVAPDTSTSITTFSPSASSAATFLKDPLWYAAKWGGFIDGNDNAKPDEVSEWDKDGDGLPDTYFFVQNPIKLRDSLQKAFKSITERNGSTSNITANGNQLTSSSLIYRATFNSGKWSGNVMALPITSSGLGTTPIWDAQSKIPAWNTRKIFMDVNGNGGNLVDTSIKSFTDLATTTQAQLSNTATYQFIRGDTSNEGSNGGTFRTRDGILGDIIHSSPAYDSENKTVFFGANDGMLHALNSEDGVERFAYIPREVLPRLKNLTSTSYLGAHEYFVDGDISLGFKFTQTNDTKYLYTLLGRGGKGLFSLKVEGTASTALTPSRTWDYTPGGNTTAAADPNLGFMLGQPTFVLLNNGKAALIAGNGYNSTSGTAALYIFILNPDGSLFQVKKLDTGVGSDNGLAAPAWIDTDNNYTADSVFAGDLKGNVWKFNIADTNPANWAVAYGGQPVFKAVDAFGNAQPITAPMYLKRNNIKTDANYKKDFLFFGTGSYFQTNDPNNLAIQSWYGIYDDTSVISSRGNLKQRTLTNGTVAGNVVRSISKAVANDMTGMRGWYIDFKDPINGERIVNQSQIISSVEQVLLVSSFYPITGDPCTPGGEGYLNYISPFTGGSLENSLYDINGDGKFNDDDKIGGATGSYAGSRKLPGGIPTNTIFVGSGNRGNSSSSGGPGGGSSELARFEAGNILTTNDNPIPPPCDDGVTCTNTFNPALCDALPKCPNALRGRISWREILKD
jgi:type IV pilus assembly protein PilY1